MAKPTIQSVMNDPTTSTWLTASLIAALELDPVDAANDAEVLVGLLSQRCLEQFETMGGQGAKVKAGMARAKRQGTSLGRPGMMELLDWPMIDELRARNISWQGIANNHKRVLVGNYMVKPSEATIRLLYWRRMGPEGEQNKETR